MENPLAFGGAVLMGFGVLEILFGPAVARMAGFPAGASRLFLQTGVVTFAIGAGMFLFAT